MEPLITHPDKVKNWQVYKSLKPIWQDQPAFSQSPKTNSLVVHARSASFSKDKRKLEYNQPYIDNDICFVFNGIIKGVRLKRKVEGAIGSQKVFSLLKGEIKKNRPEKALKSVAYLLQQNARKVVGLNIGLIINNKLFALCQYEENKRYFELKYYQDQQLAIVCSEPVGPYHYTCLQKGEIKAIDIKREI